MRIPFDIKYRTQIESGEYKLITREGKNAEILKWDLVGNRHILAVVETEYDESPYKYWPNGHIISDIDDNYDLFIVTPEPEMTEFEFALRNAMSDTVALSEDREDYEVSEICDKQAKRYSAELLSFARQQLLQSGKLLTQEHHEKLMETLREECKKDLPRWRKGSIEGDRIVGLALYHDLKWIPFSDLEKLPGFKDKSHE